MGLLASLTHGTVIATALLDYLCNNTTRVGKELPTWINLELSYRLVKCYLKKHYLDVEIPRFLQMIDCISSLTQGTKIAKELEYDKDLIIRNQAMMKQHIDDR